MDRESLLDTIRRLLALSESPNEHEAALAAAKAAELMAQHNIELAQLETPPEHEWVTEDVSDEMQRMRPEEPILASILENYFFVVAVFTRRWAFKDAADLTGQRVTVLFIFGERHNVAIARYVAGYLRRTFQRLAKQARVPHAARRSYFLGLRTTVCEKLEAQRRKSTQSPSDARALVKIDADTQAAFREHYRNIKARPASRGSFDERMYERGRCDGQTITINPAIGRGDRTPIAATQCALPSPASAPGER